MAEYGDATQMGEEQGYEQLVESGSGDQDGNLGDKINASKNDDDSRKIFVGGLSWETTAKDLKEYFEKFGTVVDSSLKTDQITGRSRGFGFVLFSESGAVSKVLGKAHVLHGKTIDPKKATARGGSGGREPIKKVFVGGLDPSVPESDIRSHFERYGTIEEIDLPFDKMKGQRRAFCFITFDSESTVDKVCADPKQKIGDADKQVDVKKATPKNEQGGWGGGFGGQRGGGGRGGQRGGGRGGYDQSGWGNSQGYGQGYGGYNNQGYGGGYYDYNNQGYGGYDYNNYYGNQGWGNYGNQGYGGQGNNSYGGYGSGQQSQGGSSYKAASGTTNHGYHPYSH